MNEVLFMFLAVLVLAASGGCATVGGYGGLPAVVAANAALPYQILAAGQIGSAYGQSYGTPYGNVPVCRLQDLQGLPPVSQPVLVRVPKSKGHRTADILGAATVVGGIAYINSGYDWRAGTVGAGTGSGGGLLWANHERDDLCLYLPLSSPKP